MKQIRNTKSKTEILTLINSSEVALSHAEIHTALNGLCDRVTIYRVLDRLSEEGAVHKIVNVDGVVKYAMCHNCETKHNHDHLHFSCENCKKVVCIENVVPEIQLPANYVIHDYNFVVSGICPDCG
ncbi:MULTISPECIES: Fur family transcriptional regulator [Chryseobacterium]|uniref:Transcriptional repressor n=1 Tax=Chryseobacterium oryzae TaxID=2929799 RepID=A0ABY4BLL0_9FLAO|nr:MULTISPECIES: transcriptional repressor [Chryseobacterium]UOE37480.1 transcriptional repressor [Chryseobacterium oryzae]VXC32526.1 Fur family transcriptional regulator [Chryseobacterium sp. 8AT]